MLGGGEPVIEHVSVASHRILDALGAVVRRVLAVGEKPFIDSGEERFLVDFGQVLRSIFARLFEEVGTRGLRDAADLFDDADFVSQLLSMFAVVPSLVVRDFPRHVAGAVPSQGRSVDSPMYSAESARVLRVATWNIAGGHTSAQAPRTWTPVDNRASVLEEVLRWGAVHACSVVALQECEHPEPYARLLAMFDFVGAASAEQDSRGFVHLYVVRGMSFQKIDDSLPSACVVARVNCDTTADGSAAERVVSVVALHLPSGEKYSARRGSDLSRALAACPLPGAVLVVGDLNSKDDQVLQMCKQNECREARYAGASWGALGNRFYANAKYVGGGFRFDRVLFRGPVWVEAHLVGQSKVFVDGLEFYRSDHFGLLAYVAVDDVYALDCAVMRASREHVEGSWCN